MFKPGAAIRANPIGIDHASDRSQITFFEFLYVATNFGDALFSRVKGLLKEYQFASPRIQLQFVDYLRDGTAARKVKQDYKLSGAVLRKRCRVGGGVVIVPGVVVGEEAFIAAGAVLTRDAPPRAVMMGVPSLC